MPLIIPKRYKTGFRRLLALEGSQTEELAAALTKASPTIDFKELAAELRSENHGIQVADLEEILRTLYSLFQALATTERTSDEFISDLLDAVRNDGELRPENVELATGFRPNLERLLAIEPLAILAKAYSLQREHEHILHEARVLTDLRPIFTANPEEDPEGMIVVHTLKITFHESLGGHKELYLALDDKDIAQMRRALERAEAKAKTLGSVLDRKGIRNVGPFDHGNA